MTSARARWQIRSRNLSAQFQRREADRLFEADGGRVYYAIDNDVVTLVTAPWRSLHLPYLHDLFDADDSEGMTDFAYVFANYFLQSSPEVPYLLVDPADIELQGTWNRVFEKAKTEHTGRESGLETLINGRKLHEDNAAHDRAAFDLLHDALAVAYRQSGSIIELHRIVELVKTGNVRPLYSYVDEFGRSPFALPEPDDEQEIQQIERSWRAELDRVRPHATDKRTRKASDSYSSVDDYNNVVDAAVLAKIEWLNTQFAAQRKPTRRICLVTGDATISRIADRRVTRMGTFGEAYIRGPLCFLSDREFFASSTFPVCSSLV